MTARRIPVVVDDQLLPVDTSGQTSIGVGSPEWYAWLDDPSRVSFSYQTPNGPVTVRREQKRNGWYWYAYHTHNGKLRKAYLGKAENVTPERLLDVAAALTAQGATDATAPTVRLTFFGAPRLARDGHPVALTAAKALALLAYLSTHDRPQPREQLLALLWPESTDAAARKNLRNVLWRVRAALGPDVLQGEERLAVHERVWADVRSFEQAHRTANRSITLEQGATDRGAERRAPLHAYRTMINLYQGSFLEGLTLADAPEFEQWLTTMRERFHELHMHALHELAVAYRAQARWPDVMTLARTALAEDALQESMYRALMEAHAHMGDRAAALRQYAALRDTLDRELGVAPLPETDRLRAEILDGSLTDQRPFTAVHQETSANGDSAYRSLSSDRRVSREQPFIGRDNELAMLDAAWMAARAGQERVVLISGEAGIGKSRLWQMWSARLDPSTTALMTRCLPTTQHLPFAPLVDVLRCPAIRQRLTALAQVALPAWLADIVRLAPDLRDALPNLSLSPALPPIEEQRRIFEALVLSMGLAPGHPIVLFVDDLHWADRTTLDWLGYLLHRSRDLPFLLVGAYRPEEAPPALTRLAVQWGREGLIYSLPLNRLSRAETAALIAALNGDPRRTDALYDQSAGNPYFLIELLRSEPGVVPAALTDLIANRLARLSSAARQVLQAAVVLQPEIDFTMLSQTSGYDDEETLDALDALLEAGLLVEQGRQYVFGHPLIAHVVDTGLSGARRAILHRRAAEALERLDAARQSEVAGRLTQHYREAGDTERAARYAELAGVHALDISAPTEAVHFYEEALALVPTPERYNGLGLARNRLADLAGARKAFEVALQGFEQIGDRRGAARVCLELARTYFMSSQADAVTYWVKRGRAYLQDEHDPTAQAMAAYLLGAELRFSNGSLDQAAAHLNEARVLATEGNALALLPGIMIELGNVYAQQGDLTNAITCYRELIEHARAVGDHLHEVIGYNNLAYHTLLTGDVVAAQDAVETGMALAEAHDVRMVYQWLYSTRGEIALAGGRWDTAETWITRAMVEAERYGNTAQVAASKANLGLLARGRGKLEDAEKMLEVARTMAADVSVPYLQTQIDLWLVELYQAGGKATAATAALSRAEARLQRSDYARLRVWAERLGNRE